jgi:hypothetical protein
MDLKDSPFRRWVHELWMQNREERLTYGDKPATIKQYTNINETKMNPQAPAEGVLKWNDWGQSKMYKVVCQCGNDDCTHTLDIEADDTGVAVIIYTRTRTNFWSKTRWSHVWRLLTTGHVEFETSILLTEQSALNYAETLKSAIQDVKHFKKP